MNISNLAKQGVVYGGILAIAPVTVTATIACSRIILIRVIMQVVMRIFGLDQLYLRLPASWVGIVKVPFLWKCSAVAAGVGLLTACINLFIYDKIYSNE